MKIGLLLAEATGTVEELEASSLPEPLAEPEELSLAAEGLCDAGELPDTGEEYPGAELAEGITIPVSVGAVASLHPSLQVTTEVRIRVLVKVTGWLMTVDPLVTEVHETIKISNDHGDNSDDSPLITYLDR